MPSHQHTYLIHQSATRKKSCSGCVKAKRRCDLILPKCSRCRAKGSQCSYNDIQFSHGSSSENASSSVGSSQCSSPNKSALDNEAAIGASVSPVNSTHSAGLDPLLEFVDCVDRMSTFDVPFKSFAFPERGCLNTGQSNYLVAHFRLCIETFVAQNQNPFIHPGLYQGTMPDIYQDALAVCGLYMQKTTQNRKAIFQILDKKLTALIQNSADMLCRLKDNLLALQALILYQIIRLFDDDIQQRANAEQHLELLDLWTLSLHQNYFQILLVPEGESTYKRWVLVESIRRTTMLSVLLRSVVFGNQNGYCQLVPLLCTLPVSDAAHLWNIPETEWGNEDLTHKVEVLTYAKWVQQWNAGNISGIDRFGKMLLVTCRYAIGSKEFMTE